MGKRSAGLLPYRITAGGLEVFIVHPGGPLWSRRDLGAWSIAKGEYDEGEDPLTVAKREFEEEVGAAAPDGVYDRLGEVRQRGGKVVTAFAVEVSRDVELQYRSSNTFSMEWPRGSGRQVEFPEVDRAAWFAFADATERLLDGQRPLLGRLAETIGQDGNGEDSAYGRG